jgi:hypothetical protein
MSRLANVAAQPAEDSVVAVAVRQNVVALAALDRVDRLVLNFLVKNSVVDRVDASVQLVLAAELDPVDLDSVARRRRVGQGGPRPRRHAPSLVTLPPG